MVRFLSAVKQMMKRVGKVEMVAVAKEELPLELVDDEGKSPSISRRGICQQNEEEITNRGRKLNEGRSYIIQKKEKEE
jgi:hypothetical protein